MSSTHPPRVAIIDYGVGNLFSIARACVKAGVDPLVTSDKQEILAAAGVILPGVGAFGDAIAMLHKLDLVEPLREISAAGRPLLGVCLGMQLMMSESEEFGRHEGLNLIPGRVVRFHRPTDGERSLKVPQVGWNRIERPVSSTSTSDLWENTPLEGLTDGASMYFVHSFYCRPEDPATVLSVTTYGNVRFCSSIRRGSTVAVQYHPEKSGPEGLQIYRTWAQQVQQSYQQGEHHHAA